MKYKSLILIGGLFVVVLACQSTPIPPAPTATIAPATNTVKPTATSTEIPVPTATPVLLPNEVNSTFSSVSILYTDSFQFKFKDYLPDGWVSEEKYSGWVTEDNQFKIQPRESTVFYFSQTKITQNEGIYFTFKYTGSKQGFSLGFDALNRNGERIKFGEGGFYSVAMQMNDDVATAHINKDGWVGSDFFSGNMKLQEDTWYDIVLGMDDSNNYIIKLWLPNMPDQQITYYKKWDGFPQDYYFISWIAKDRSLLIDDFSIFKFGEILQK